MVNSIADKHVCLWREHKKEKKSPAWRDWSVNWRRYSTGCNAYSLATVNISSYAVLITWPRYNNMDYSYPRFPAWCDASRGKRVSKFTGLHKACGIRNPMLRCFHAEMLSYNYHQVSDSIMLTGFACASFIAGANKDTTACRSTDFKEIFKEFQTLIRSNYMNAKTGLHIVLH